MSAVYRQSNLKANVALEKGTENVPKDNRYHLLVEGKVVNSYRTLKEAKDAYEKELTARNISTEVKEITMTDAARKAFMKEAVSGSYQSESSASVKMPKKSGARRYG